MKFNIRQVLSLITVIINYARGNLVMDFANQLFAGFEESYPAEISPSIIKASTTSIFSKGQSNSENCSTGCRLLLDWVDLEWEELDWNSSVIPLMLFMAGIAISFYFTTLAYCSYKYSTEETDSPNCLVIPPMFPFSHVGKDEVPYPFCRVPLINSQVNRILKCCRPSSTPTNEEEDRDVDVEQGGGQMNDSSSDLSESEMCIPPPYLPSYFREEEAGVRAGPIIALGRYPSTDSFQSTDDELQMRKECKDEDDGDGDVDEDDEDDNRINPFNPNMVYAAMYPEYPMEEMKAEYERAVAC